MGTIIYNKKKLKEVHEKIRTILMDNGSKEYGDCIIDEICEAVSIPPTTVYYEEMTKIEEAKKTLTEAGYYTGNLWQIDDVKGKNAMLDNQWTDATDEQAMDVLEMAFKNDATYEQIWMSIDYAIEELNPNPKKS